MDSRSEQSSLSGEEEEEDGEGKNDLSVEVHVTNCEMCLHCSLFRAHNKHAASLHIGIEGQ